MKRAFYPLLSLALFCFNGCEAHSPPRPDRPEATHQPEPQITQMTAGQCDTVFQEIKRLAGRCTLEADRQRVAGSDCDGANCPSCAELHTQRTVARVGGCYQ